MWPARCIHFQGVKTFKRKQEFPEAGIFVFPFLLGLAVSPFFGASSSRGEAPARNCSWREELVTDAVSGNRASLPVLECDSLEIPGAKDRYGVATPDFHFTGGLNCSFVPAEFVFPEEGGPPELRVLPEARDARLYHLKKDLERLSRDEDALCLPPSAVKVEHPEPIATSAAPPAARASPPPAPAPALRPLSKALVRAVEALPENARVCVVTDRSGSMQPQLRSAREALLRAASPSNSVEWGTVDASSPENQNLSAKPIAWIELLSSLGANSGPANSHERIIDSVAACREWLISPGTAAGEPRKIWVLSDEQDAPRGVATLLGSVRARFKTEGIELQFLDPNHQRCPQVARDGLRDSTRAAWITRMQAPGSGSGGFDARCAGEVARAAIWDWLGPEAWTQVRRLVSTSPSELVVEASGVLLLAALLDPDSGLTPSEAVRWYGGFVSACEAFERSSGAEFIDGFGSGIDGSDAALSDLRSQVTRAYRRRFP